MKKFLALLCVLALILCLFSGCKGDNKQDNKPTETVSKELSDEELAKIVAKNLGVPDSENITYTVSEKYYWDAAGSYFKNVTFREKLSFSNYERMVAFASVDPIDGALFRNIGNYYHNYPIPETATEKLLREIDNEYKKESFEGDGSTGAMVDRADKYTKKWQEVADEYYNKLMEYDGIVQMDETCIYSSDDFHKFIKNMKTSWEKYHAEQCENYEKALYAIYNGGSLIGPVFADYKYEEQKEWALQLVSIYEQL